MGAAVPGMKVGAGAAVSGMKVRVEATVPGMKVGGGGFSARYEG